MLYKSLQFHRLTQIKEQEELEEQGQVNAIDYILILFLEVNSLKTIYQKYRELIFAT
jgi:hypothetical protein